MLLRSGMDLGYRLEKRSSPLEDERFTRISTQMSSRRAIDTRMSRPIYHTFVAEVSGMVGIGVSFLESACDAADLFASAVSYDIKNGRDPFVSNGASKEDFEGIQEKYDEDFPFFSWDVEIAPKKLVAYVHYDQEKVCVVEWFDEVMEAFRVWRHSD